MAGLFSNLANDEATYMASSAENAARAEEAAVQAGQSADSASASAASAAQSASTIGSQVQTTTVNAQSAKTSEDNAKASELAAKASELAAKDSETNSEFYAIRAENADHDMQVQIDEARAWASQDTGTVNGTTEYSSKYYSVQSGLHESKAKEWSSGTGVIETDNTGDRYSARYYSVQSGNYAGSAQVYEQQAEQHVQDAETQANRASSFATQAQGYASSANNVLTTVNAQVAVAAGHANDALSYSQSASTFATNSQTSANEAEQHELKADKWANYTDGTVEGNIGQPDAKYSAKYWAQQAESVIGAGYVLRTGDVMTGDLSIIKEKPSLYFGTATGSQTTTSYLSLNPIPTNSLFNGLVLNNDNDAIVAHGSGKISLISYAASANSFLDIEFKNDSSKPSTTNGVINFKVGTTSNPAYTRVFSMDENTGNFTLGGDIVSTVYGGSLKEYIDTTAGNNSGIEVSSIEFITMNGTSGLGWSNAQSSMRSNIKYNPAIGMAELYVDFTYCANQANTPTALPTTKLMMGKFSPDLLPVRHGDNDSGIIGGDILSRTTGAKIGEWTFDGLANPSEGRIYIVRANNSTDTAGGRFHYTYFYK